MASTTPTSAASPGPNGFLWALALGVMALVVVLLFAIGSGEEGKNLLTLDPPTPPKSAARTTAPNTEAETQSEPDKEKTPEKAQSSSEVQTEAKPSAQPTVQASTEGGLLYEHEVQSGELLGTLAQRYGVKIARIQQANGLADDKIRLGQKLKIPIQAFHKVEPGQGWFTLKKKYGVEPDRIRRANGLSGETLPQDRELIIPLAP